MNTIDKSMNDFMNAQTGNKPQKVSESSLNALLSLHGWGLRRHVSGEIVVTHKDGSGVLIKEGDALDDLPIAETMFYRMMNDFLNNL